MFRGLAELGAFTLLRDWVVSPERVLPAPWAEFTPAVLLDPLLPPHPRSG